MRSETDQRPAGHSNSWKTIFLRAAGIGGGFAVVAALLIGGVIWWMNKPRLWSSTAITAKPTQLRVNHVGQELRVEIRYAITNHTTEEYTLPTTGLGALMRKLPKEGSLEKIDDAAWDTTTGIPPNQTVNITFVAAYPWWDSTMPSKEADPEKAQLIKLAADQLEQIDSLTFFDYRSKYRIEMPRNWDMPKEPGKR
jgi:hypothetical protein